MFLRIIPLRVIPSSIKHYVYILGKNLAWLIVEALNVPDFVTSFLLDINYFEFFYSIFLLSFVLLPL